MIQVKLHPLLAKRAHSQQEQREIAYEPGLRAVDLLLREGFRAVDAEAVMMLCNDDQIEPETALHDGDRVEFMVAIQGG